MEFESRLARLEWQCRLYRNLFALAGLLIVALVLYGASEPVPDLIQARALEILNSAGKPVVILQSDLLGGMIVTHAHQPEARTPSIEMGTARQGGGIYRLFNGAGTEVVSLGTARGHGVAAIHSNEGFTGVYLLGRDSDNKGGLIALLNNTGEEVAQAYANQQGQGVVAVWDRTGRGREFTPGQ